MSDKRDLLHAVDELLRVVDEWDDGWHGSSSDTYPLEREWEHMSRVAGDLPPALAELRSRYDEATQAYLRYPDKLPEFADALRAEIEQEGAVG